MKTISKEIPSLIGDDGQEYYVAICSPEFYREYSQGAWHREMARAQRQLKPFRRNSLVSENNAVRQG